VKQAQHKTRRGRKVKRIVLFYEKRIALFVNHCRLKNTVGKNYFAIWKVNKNEICCFSVFIFYFAFYIIYENYAWEMGRNCYLLVFRHY
jgi:hypothetical protein